MPGDERSMRERMLAGDRYIADDPELYAEHQRAMVLMEAFNTSPAADADRRRELLRALLGSIGDDVQIGPRVQLLTATHPLEPNPRRDKWESSAPITVADNVWLGGGVIVCPGVTIGENTVVGAGAVVTRDLPSGVLALGTPARVVRSVDEPTE